MDTKIYKLADYKPSNFLIPHIDITLDLTQAPVRSISQLTIQPAAYSLSLTLNGENMELLSLKINNQTLAPEEYILTPTSLTIKNPPQSEFTLQTETKLFDNPDLFGLYQTENTWLVKAETEGMRRVIYCLDRPDVLSTYTTTIIADKTDYPILLSNGHKIKTLQLDNNKHAITWQDDIPKATYLFAIVAGKLEYTATTHKTPSNHLLPIEFYVPAQALDKCEFAKEIIKAGLTWEENTYQLECDLPQHMVAGVDKYPSGASEPTGLNLFNTQNLFASPATKTDIDILRVADVVSHELFHYWSGDRVTIRDWFNLCYKEGLTTYRAADFNEHLFGADLMRMLEGKNKDKNVPRPDHYSAVRSLYTGAAYGKSSEIFRMLSLVIGKKNFYQAMHEFFRQNINGAVTIEEVLEFLSTASKQDLTGFLTWFTTGGVPIITVTDCYDPQQKVYKLTIKQSGEGDYVSRPIPIRMGLLSADGVEIVNDTTLMLTQPEMEFKFENIPAPPIPSLLRNYSAPVTLQYAFTLPQLLTLMQFDSNMFNRQEAARNLIIKLMSDDSLQINNDIIAAYRRLLNDKQINPWILVLIIKMPSEEELITLFSKPDIERIAHAHSEIRNALAKSLKDELDIRLQELLTAQPTSNPQFPDFDIHAAGKRQLKQVCMQYLSYVEPDKIKKLALTQFETSLTSNMNETINALSLLFSLDHEASKHALEKFYQTWQHDSNVINYWLRLQARSHSPQTIEVVAGLMQHPVFDMTVPNKVMALFGPFLNNPYGFHHISGKGYELLTKLILKLETIQPALAAKLVDKLADIQKFDHKRQTLMRAQLHLLKAKAKSVNVIEALQKLSDEQSLAMLK